MRKLNMSGERKNEKCEKIESEKSREGEETLEKRKEK